MAEDAEEELGAHLLLALLERISAPACRARARGLEVVRCARSSSGFDAEVLDEAVADALPVPVLRRLVRRAALLDHRADDAVDEIEQALALLA